MCGCICGSWLVWEPVVVYVYVLCVSSGLFGRESVYTYVCICIHCVWCMSDVICTYATVVPPF